MAVNEMMLELAEELVNPAEISISEQIEDMLDDEEDVIMGTEDDDDRLIEFIARGERITNEEVVDFSQYDGEYIIEDDDDEDDDDDFEDDDDDEKYDDIW